MSEVLVADVSVRELGKRWWWFLVLGIIAVVVGGIIIIRPMTGVFGLAVIIAVGLLLSGLGELVTSGTWGRQRWIPILWGVLSLVAALIAVVWPEITLWALAVVIGIGFIMRGVLRAGAAVAGRPHLWGLWALVGLIELVAGVLAIVWPGITILVLAVVIGIDLVLVGVAEIVFAFELKRQAA